MNFSHVNGAVGVDEVTGMAERSKFGPKLPDGEQNWLNFSQAQVQTLVGLIKTEFSDDANLAGC